MDLKDETANKSRNNELLAESESTHQIRALQHKYVFIEAKKVQPNMRQGEGFLARIHAS